MKQYLTKFSFLAAFAVLVFGPTATSAASFEVGAEAYKTGDFVTALKEFKALERQLKKQKKPGDPRAQYRIARMYENGWGTSVNLSRAVYWHRKAASQDYSLAYYQLGRMYHTGRGLKFDEASAINCYLKAAALGDSRAWFRIGQIHANPSRLERNIRKAATMFEKGAKGGDRRAQFSLGQLFAVGSGVIQDNGKAMDLYMASAKQNDVDALYTLGRVYERGSMADKDLVKAFSFYTLASAAGHDRAQNATRDLQDMLTRDQRSAGLQMAQNFKVTQDINETEYD